MAHFAQLDDNNIVTQVLVVANQELLDETGVESEEKGISFCRDLFGPDTRWVQTSYSGSIRKQFAAVGFRYDATADVFISPCLVKGMVLNPVTFDWEYPYPAPTDGFLYRWDEESESWQRIPKPFPSWVLDSNGSFYTPPVPQPTDGQFYTWDEATLSWQPDPDEPSA